MDWGDWRAAGGTTRRWSVMGLVGGELTREPEVVQQDCGSAVGGVDCQLYLRIQVVAEESLSERLGQGELHGRPGVLRDRLQLDVTQIRVVDANCSNGCEVIHAFRLDNTGIRQYG